MRNTFKLSIIILLFFVSQSALGQQTYLRDTTITAKNSVTGLYVNDQLLENFIRERQITGSEAEGIKQFYGNRDFQFAWFNEDGLAEQTQSFWNLYENFLSYSGDSSLYNSELHDRIEELTTFERSFDIKNPEVKSTELQLTALFLNFVERAYAGKVNPKSLQWHIPRKKIDALHLLNEFVQNNGREPESILPANPQYLLLKEKILGFKMLTNSGWPEFSLGKKKVYKLGDSAALVTDIKKRLNVLGDFHSPDKSNVFDGALEAAVLTFQKRHGLTDDGIVGPDFIRTINIPIEKRIERMLINMERMRWMPARDDERSVIVNIPEFRLRVYEGRDEVLSMDVVVGKAANRTVIFSDKIKHVVFSPYWNIPRSIIRNEILPAIERNPRYLTRHNMEKNGVRNGLPVIRQKPGRKNALGRVKFIFPNRYSIYLHDTPAKRLFQRTNRAFSHGCIRVAEPFELAKYLLKDRPEWTDEKIERAMHSNSEKWVGLNRPVPVFISYFTAWVDEAGLLNFRDDIYGHDKKVAAHLF